MERIAIVGKSIEISRSQMGAFRRFGEVKVYRADRIKLDPYIRDATILITYCQVRRKVLLELRACRLLISWQTGLDNIDLDFAKGCGIEVRNCVDYCTKEVAEHTISLMLALSRNICKTPRKTPILLAGKTLGIIGYGYIGKEVARIASNMGMSVVVCSANKDHPYKQNSLNPLLRTSDVIVVCTSLRKETKGMIGLPELLRLKQEAIVVNTARAEIIDPNGLARFINRRSDVRFGLDVVYPSVGEKIKGIVTNHVGYLSEYSPGRCTDRCLETLKEVLG